MNADNCGGQKVGVLWVEHTVREAVTEDFKLKHGEYLVILRERTVSHVGKLLRLSCRISRDTAWTHCVTCRQAVTFKLPNIS